MLQGVHAACHVGRCCRGSDGCGLLLVLRWVLLLVAEAGCGCLQRHELLLLLDSWVH
jgi:hypothetical protein